MTPCRRENFRRHSLSEIELQLLCWDLRHTLRRHRQGPFVEQTDFNDQTLYWNRKHGSRFEICSATPNFEGLAMFSMHTLLPALRVGLPDLEKPPTEPVTRNLFHLFCFFLSTTKLVLRHNTGHSSDKTLDIKATKHWTFKRQNHAFKFVPDSERSEYAGDFSIRCWMVEELGVYVSRLSRLPR
jgi:hypothetical protein